MFVSGIPYFYAKLEKSVIDYFERNNAYSEDTALEPDLSKIQDGSGQSYVIVNLRRYEKFIKRVGDTSKYYLDKDAYIKIKKIDMAIYIILAAGFIALFAYALISMVTLR